MRNTSELRVRIPAEGRNRVRQRTPESHQNEWENFARAQQLGQIGWWRLDTTRNVLTWSAENYRIFGAPPGEPQTYQTFLDAVHPDDRTAVDEGWRAALRGEPYDIEHRIVANGQVKWVREKATLEFDESGALRGAFGITQDITDRKAVEHALQWSVRRNELLTKTAARLLETSDVQGIVDDLCAEVMRFLECDVFFNFLADERARRLRLNACAGIPRAVAEEIEWLDFGVAVCGCVARDRERIIAERIGDLIDERTTLISSFGIQAYCCHPLMSQGKLIGTLSFGARSRSSFRAEEIEVMQAVSNLVAMAMARLGMEQALREADRRKDEFLATLAHELRNPLAPIRSGLHVLKSGGGEGPHRARVAEIMARQIDHIVRLVDDLMEVSRIRSGKIALRLERVDLVEVVRQAVESCQQVMDASGVVLSVATPDAPLYVEGDPVRLSQIVCNLLNNAGKYTEAGGRVDIAASGSDGWATLSVSDTGVGIPKEMLPHVFDLFAQVDRTLGRAQGGLGIGLALVRKLVTLHGGDVEAQSGGPGLGSRFTLRLPLSQDAATGDTAEKAPSSEPVAKRVLVIDDNRDAAVSMSMLLETLGADARVASDAESGVEAFEVFHPSLVFLDLGMPGVDGFETARRLRATQEGREATIVALTGWGGEDTRARTREAGFDLHLTKPASIDDVQRALAFPAKEITTAAPAQ
jgi:PAS domain S-box-containing protein